MVAAALYFLRGPIAGAAVRQAMANAGMTNPAARVTSLSLTDIELRDVAFGPVEDRTLRIDAAKINYDWRTMLRERRVSTITAGPGQVRLLLDEQGRLSLPGLNLGAGNVGGGAVAPFEAITLTDLGLILQSPEGVARGVVSADYDFASGGAAAAELASEQFGINNIFAENASISFDVNLAEDGNFSAIGRFSGDITARAGKAQSAAISFSTTGRSWRKFVTDDNAPLVGEALLAIDALEFDVDNAGVFADLRQETEFFFGEPVSTISFAGALVARTNGRGYEISFDEKKILTAKTNTGATLHVSPLDGAPVFSYLDGAPRIGLSYDVSGGAIDGLGTLRASRENDVWYFEAPAKIGAYRSDAIAFQSATISTRGEYQSDRARADISLQTNIEKADIGRLSIRNTPVDGAFSTSISLDDRRMFIRQRDDACVAIAQSQMEIDEQDMDIILRNARICMDENNFAEFTWNEEILARVQGVVDAGDARYRLGQTVFAGRPPTIKLTANYAPANQQTNIDGVLSGGAFQYNEMLAFAGAKGAFTFSLNGERMAGDADIDDVRLSFVDEPPLVAPVHATGKAILNDRDAEFQFTVKTPGGFILGKGAGAHDVQNATGEATIDLEALRFSPANLQPENLAPVLRGIVGETTGAVDGQVNIAWRPDELGSNAALSFDALTFEGPGITVTQTADITGDIALSALWPIETDGPQRLSIGRIDLSALQLENGEVIFEMPGDQTLRVERAVFPWFGGELGVYGANAAMTGGSATARLEAASVNIALMLEAFDVDGLRGEGRLSGVLPLVIEDGKARIENGVLRSDGPGFVQYSGQAAETAAQAGEQAEIAFSILRDLQFESLAVTVDGPLDGSIDFQMVFEGRGDVPVNQQSVRVPVKYTINLEAALLDLLNQANRSRDVQMLIEDAVSAQESAN
ncbi:MAG: YdbH domain-containing protein [Pseudomonadota bacterium]